jgi:putative aldouronate transport system substrate-binding protein
MKENKISRRGFMQAGAIAAGGTILAACAPAATPTATQAPAATATTAPQPTATTAAAAATATSAPVAAMTAEELLTKAGLPLPGAPNNPKGWKVTFPALPEGMPLDPMVTITGSRRVDSTVTFPEGKGVDNNMFTDYMKALLGIEWKAAWTWIAAEDGDQKYNMAMAANDLPDLCENVGGTILVKMYEADLVEDITDAFDNLASEQWIKSKWAPFGNLPWAYASYEGRKKGWPYVERAYQNDKVMWMRQDWLDKLGLAAPTTIDELYAVATAFKKAGLGQGAAGSTLGIAAQQELGYSWYGSFDPIVGSIAGTLPGYWTEGPDGKLANGTVDPRMKNALQTLALWYKEGLIPADFPTRPTAEAEKLVAGNQVGIHFTPAWDSGWGCAESKKNDPTAVWKPYDIPAGAEGKKKHWSNPFAGVVSPIRKGMKYVDAFIKQNNFNAEWGENPEYRCFNNPPFEGLTFNIVDGKVVNESMSYMKWGFGPIGGTGGGGVDPARDDTNLRYQLSWKDIAVDKRDAAQATFFDDPTGATTLYQEAALLVAEVSEAEGIKNMFNSLPTKTMVELGTDLGTSGGENNRLGSLATETLTAIITGQKPLDAFDEFVSTWKSLGGDQITTEVNDWYATQK